MSYGGRRGQNVSQYLRELNTVPNHDSAQEDFAIDDELALFTNTQFFDFDSGQNTDFQPQPVKPDPVETQASPEDVTSTAGDFAGLDFMSGDFSFGDFGASYTSPTIQAFPDSIGGLQPIQPNPQGVYHQQSSYGHPSSQVGDKGKPETPTTMAPPGRPMSFEEASRLAAEEDKRRRNTAASARFRIKKKQREQALEKSAKEMTEKVTALEGRIQQLETENKWLKNLIMEKNDGSQDVASLWKDVAARRESEKVPEPINGSSSKDPESSPTSKADSEPTGKEK